MHLIKGMECLWKQVEDFWDHRRASHLHVSKTYYLTSCAHETAEDRQKRLEAKEMYEEKSQAAEAIEGDRLWMAYERGLSS